MTPPRRFYQRGWFQLTAGVLVSLACLAWAFRSMTRAQSTEEVLTQIGSAFRQADYRSLPIMLTLVLVFYWLKAWRWAILLRPVGRYGSRNTFPPVMIGFAFNNLLPAHLGEFVRVYVFARRQQVNFGAVLSTVVLERIFDILAILGFFLLGLAFTPGLPDEMQRVAWGGAIIVALGLVVAAAYLVWTRPVVNLIEALLARIRLVPAGLRGKIVRLMEGGAAGLASLKSGGLVAAIGLNSVLQWAINGLLMHLALWSFDIHVSPFASCLLLGVTAFAVTIPASPGYFGVIQAAFLGAINEHTVPGVSQEAVFAASIYYQMGQYVLVTALGLFLFNLQGLRMSDVRQHAVDARQQRDDAGINDAPAGL